MPIEKLARFTNVPKEVSTKKPTRLLPEAFIRKINEKPIPEKGISVICIDKCTYNKEQFSLGADIIKKKDLCAYGWLNVSDISTVEYDKDNNYCCCVVPNNKTHKEHYEICSDERDPDKKIIHIKKTPLVILNLRKKVQEEINKKIAKTTRVTRKLARKSLVVWKEEATEQKQK